MQESGIKVFSLGRRGERNEGIKEFQWELIQDQRTVPVAWWLDTVEPSQRLMADILSAGGMYEVETVVAIISVLREGGTFFDVGAHCGFFSVIASALVGEAGQVVAFEPSASNRRHFMRNANRDNVCLVSAAVTDRDGLVDLHLCADNDGGNALWDPGKHDWNADTRAAPPNLESVRGVSLDSYAHHCPTVIKIDTEGAEVLVMKGAERVLSQPQLKLVVAEAHAFGLEQLGSSLGELITLMGEAGFAMETPKETNDNLHFWRL